MKIVRNKCYGGFGLSNEAYDWLIENKGWTITDYNDDGHGYKDETARLVRNRNYKEENKSWRTKYYTIFDKYDLECRKDPDIIAVVKFLGEKANDKYSELEIVEIPDDAVDPYIDEYDGIETVREGRSW